MASVDAFLGKWVGSAGSEKGNSQLFFTELCDALDLPHPNPAVNDAAKDDYVFERKVSIPAPEGVMEVGWIDVYRRGAFVLESKQGANVSGKGFAQRDTPAWNVEMQNALGQARRYRVIHEQGLVTILKQIHDDLDAAVFDAYGWPHDLTDEQILEKLVALNADRAAEERRGLVRWLRPEFQAPAAKKPVQVIIGGISTPSSPPPGLPSAEKRAWPKPPAEQVAALHDLIAAYPDGATFGPLDLAAQFKSKSKSLPRDIEQYLDALSTYGLLLPLTTPTGRRFARPIRAAA